MFKKDFCNIFNFFCKIHDSFDIHESKKAEFNKKKLAQKVEFPIILVSYFTKLMHKFTPERGFIIQH
jgi:hypothetical protein